ncbi:MAG: hypothetical protein ACJAT2_003027 [Bacteriovoracaceae bacterium]
MKVAIGCDHILERDRSIEIVEALCAIFPDAEVYTLAHRPKQVLGPLERKKIHSTFLSHKVSSLKELSKYSYLIPSAAKNFHITCSLDLFIDVSSGMGHGFKTCEKTKRISYLLDKKEDSIKSGFIRKFFKSYLNNWKRKNLLDERTLWVETPELEQNLKAMGKSPQILRPFVKVEDFKVIKSAGFKHSAYLINALPLNEEMAEKIADNLKNQKIGFKFIGDDGHLLGLKDKLGEGSFFGEKCHGELAPLMSSAAGLIDFDTHPYSPFTLECLASGRPVLKNKKDVVLEDLNGLVPFSNMDELFTKLPSLSHESWVDKSDDLRRGVVKFNESRFKTQVKKFIERI